MTKYILAIIILWHLIFSVTGAFAVNSKDIVMLKKAGVSDRIIKEIISSDAISRALISVDEIVKYLKQYARDEETTEYGDNGDINIDIKKTRK